jgi:hypothetical protein
LATAKYFCFSVAKPLDFFLIESGIQILGKNRLRKRSESEFFFEKNCEANVKLLVHHFVNLVHNPVNLVHNFYKILKKSSHKHPMTFIRDNLVSGKMHALRAVIWRNLRVLLVRRKLSNCEPGSQNCEPGSQFRIVNQTALHPKKWIFSNRIFGLKGLRLANHVVR